MEPLSPRNMRAGWKFTARKAAAAAAIEKLTEASQPTPAKLAPKPYAEKPMTVIPPASPSEPSMKLYRFTIHTVPTTSKAAQASQVPGSAAGTTTAAPTRCEPSRAPTGSPRRSSRYEIAHNASAMQIGNQAAPGVNAQPARIAGTRASP